MIILFALISSIGVAVVAIIGDLVSQEFHGWLDLLPQATLRFAANLHLDPVQCILIYEDEWMPELTYILKGAEYRPITRLLVGMRFALSLLFSRREYETSYPAIFTVSPKDSAIKAILERLGKALDEDSENHEEITSIRHGLVKRRSYTITVGGVGVPLKRFRELYKAGPTILLDMGHECIMPMTISEFREIAEDLESMTSNQNRKPSQS